MVKLLWIDFSDTGNIRCFCEDKRQCHKELHPECVKYIAKFVEAKGTEEDMEYTIDLLGKEMDMALDIYYRNARKFKSDLEKSIKKFKI